MNKILIGSYNKGKQQEIKIFLSPPAGGLPLHFIFPQDLGITEDVEENGRTYKENAEKKALFYAKKSGLPAIADDGGIEIAALGGKPGVHSKRWVGKDSSDEKIVNHITKISRKLPENNRTAYFRNVVAFALPNGKVWSSKGEVKGIIAKKPHLKLLQGFPYRSFFYLPQIKKYYHESELTIEEMRKYNHRYKAIQKLKKIIKTQLQLSFRHE
ncbi:MAG: hypothetical protein HY429_01690 [Candidatus Levybacteria bacterium]|nr:hypothetical protein [Candidatus Levybacteria bacterium]